MHVYVISIPFSALIFVASDWCNLEYYYYYNHFVAVWTLSGTTWVIRYPKKHSSLTPIMIISHPCLGIASM